MAKIDWSKHKANKDKGEYLQNLPVGGGQYRFYKDNNLWTLKGKYQGSHIHKLPLNYLDWIVNNFKDCEAKQQAIDELYRRYAELTNT
jgi:hypothetical protein